MKQFSKLERSILIFFKSYKRTINSLLRCCIYADNTCLSGDYGMVKMSLDVFLCNDSSKTPGILEDKWQKVCPDKFSFQTALSFCQNTSGLVGAPHLPQGRTWQPRPVPPPSRNGAAGGHWGSPSLWHQAISWGQGQAKARLRCGSMGGPSLAVPMAKGTAVGS